MVAIYIRALTLEAFITTLQKCLKYCYDNNYEVAEGRIYKDIGEKPDKNSPNSFISLFNAISEKLVERIIVIDLQHLGATQEEAFNILTVLSGMNTLIEMVDDPTIKIMGGEVVKQRHPEAQFFSGTAKGRLPLNLFVVSK